MDNKFVKADRGASTLPTSVVPERYFVKSSKYAYVSFSLPDLHPDQSVEIGEPLIVENSRVEDQVHAISKDGVPITADFVVTFGFPITVSLAAEDLHAVNYDLEVLGQKAANQEELKSAAVEAVRREKEQFKNETSFWRYALAFAHPLPRQMVLLFPKFEKVPAEGGHEVDLDNGGAASTSFSYSIP